MTRAYERLDAVSIPRGKRMEEREPTTRKTTNLKGRTIFAGTSEGDALVTLQGISFFGGVDPETGEVVERGHELEGQSIAGKVLVFPSGKGSTVGSYTLYRLKKNNHAPIGIVNIQCETITAVGCIISEIPCVDQVEIEGVKTGDRIRIDGNQVAITSH